VTGGGGGPIDTRLERDVFAYKPTVMTVMLGMNDASYRAFDQGIFDTYRKGYEHIVASVKEHVPGIRMTLIQPSPYDDVAQPPKFEGGYNQVLVRYGEFVKELAAREKLNVADLNTAVVAATEKAKATDPELAKKLNPDRVHPAASGQLLMAAELLKAWDAPEIVTVVEIDAAAGKVTRAGNTKVTGLKAGNGSLSWTQKDAALPMPLDLKDPATALALKSSDFMAALNHQPLTVAGLPAGEFTLKIDGGSVGVFTHEQLAAGINLAGLATPMMRQAADVHKLTLQHNNEHFTRWRNVQVPLDSSKNARVLKVLPKLLAGLDEDEAETVRKQRLAAQPKARRYELTPK
jgi:lysophospholipase L1-like esterase